MGSEPQAARGEHHLTTVGRGYSLPLSSALLLQGDSCSSWKGPEEGESELKIPRYRSGWAD